MFLGSACSCLRTIYWSQAFSEEWRCSWSSAERRCSNYIWVINNSIAYFIYWTLLVASDEMGSVYHTKLSYRKGGSQFRPSTGKSRMLTFEQLFRATTATVSAGFWVSGLSLANITMFNTPMTSESAGVEYLYRGAASSPWDVASGLGPRTFSGQ